MKCDWPIRPRSPIARSSQNPAHSGIRNVIAESAETKQISREEIASSYALPMTIGLRSEFCAEHLQTFDDWRDGEEFRGVRH